MANYVVNITQDLAGQLERHILKSPLVRNNNNAHTFNITVVNGDDAVAMSGITANFVRSNNTTVLLDDTYCSASGNVATVTLPQSCYAYPGKAILTVNCTIGGATTCIGWFDCTVLNSLTDTVVDPGTVLPDIADLIEEIETVAASIPADYSTLSSQVSTNTGNISTLQTTMAGKQDTLTFDDTPTASSNNPVKSGGVYSALSSQYEEIANKLDANQGSANAGKIMVIDSTGEIVPGVGGSGGTVAVDSAFSSTSENPVQNKVVYAAVTKTETVSGTTPAITAVANTRYICGEVSTLDITLPASGIIDVVFESGSTATVLTVTGTVSWANDFDATALDANTTYEISIADGLGVACAWT